MLLLMLFGSVASAQKNNLTGIVKDGEMDDVLPGATVVLLNPKDSTQITGAATGQNGKFTLASKKGKFILKVSYVGYRSVFQNIEVSKSADLGTITLFDDAKLMKEAEVTAQLAQVEMKADTFMYNADAYKLPEGSTLEELVRKLPGAELGEDGTLKINGKTVSKILVKGKEFFGDDKDMTLKNLPSKMIKKIKAYDKKSDYSRITGIDDGEEETVLDLSVKKGMGEGWVVNVDVAAGNARQDKIPGERSQIEFPKPLYSGNFNASRFTDNLQFMFIASRNNTNNGSGRWGGFWGGSGVTTTTMSGLNVTWTNGLQQYTPGYMEVGGNVRYNGREAEGMTVSNSETFLGSTSSFNNARNWSNNKNHNVNADMRFQWMPDSLTTLTFRPSFSHSQNDNMGRSSSVTFNEDPYKKTAEPLNNYDDDALFIVDGRETRVNSNESESKGNGNSNSGDIHMQVNRRLVKPGRNISLDMSGNISKSDNENFNWSNIKYYQKNDNTLQDRYTISPSKSWNVRSRLSYTEPLTSNLNLQLSYSYQRRFSDNDRSMFDLDKLIGEEFSTAGLDRFAGETFMTEALLQQLFSQGLTVDGIYPFLTLAPSELDYKIKDQLNSQYATYKENNHNANLMFRYNNKLDNDQEIRLNAGLSLQPQHTLMHYQKGLVDTTVTRTTVVDTTVTRTTVNWAPRIDFRWKISNASQLRLNYNARMSQPSMTQLMEVTDDSNPLNISTGNAGLRSSWNNNMFAEYNGYRDSSRVSRFFNQSSWYLRGGYGNTRNSITSATIYDSETGGRYVRPMNINGNWNMWSNVNINTALGKQKYWNFSNNTFFNYNYRLGYLSSKENGVVITPDMYDNGRINMDKLFRSVDLSQFESATKTLGVGDWMRLNYRKSFGDNWSIDFGANAGFNYNHTRSTRQQNTNIDSWTFSYGGNATIIFPWAITFSTNITEQCRRGYDGESMNTNELLWNATLQKSFLKDKAATISVEWNDILHQRSNVSRAISEFARTDTYTNNINSYFMVHFIYRLNLLGDKASRGMMNGFGGGNGGRGGFGGGRGGYGGGGRF